MNLSELWEIVKDREARLTETWGHRVGHDVVTDNSKIHICVRDTSGRLIFLSLLCVFRIDILGDFFSNWTHTTVLLL